MDHETGRFIHNYQRLVFINDVEWNIFRREDIDRSRDKLYFDLISAAAGGDPARASYHCYSQADGCQGEGLGTGNRDAQQALIARCVPHHQ